MHFVEFPIIVRDANSEFSPADQSAVTLDLYRVESYFKSTATGKAILTMDSGDEYTLEVTYEEFKRIHGEAMVTGYISPN